jgi:hypothetical protein
VLSFWSEYDQLSDSGRKQLRDPILSRLRRLYRDPLLACILCTREGEYLGGLVDEGAIVAAGLTGRELLEGGDILGELILTQIYYSLIPRLEPGSTQSRRVYLAIDESHRFKTPVVGTIFREARKMNATLIMATQYLNSWNKDLLDSVMGNNSQVITFKCGSQQDANMLASQLQPFTSDMLQDLDMYEVVAKLKTATGTNLPALCFKTKDVETPPNEAKLDRIRQRTRARFCKPRAEVEKELGRDIYQADQKAAQDDRGYYE